MPRPVLLFALREKKKMLIYGRGLASEWFTLMSASQISG